jgi:hypothetical protein
MGAVMMKYISQELKLESCATPNTYNAIAIRTLKNIKAK